MTDYIGLLGAALCTMVALMTIAVLGPPLGLRVAPSRFRPIDGLRGYAAFFVFISHSASWFYYARTDRWAIMPVRAYGNLGSVSVVVFFMITAFLFTTKLLDSRGGSVDWLRMLVSRIMRLTPLYLFAMAAVIAVVGAVSGFERSESLGTLLSNFGQWLTFTIVGAPDLNGIQDTWLVIAGVTWSLPYEIAFYLSLPALAVLIGAPSTKGLAVAMSTLIAAAIFHSRPDPVLAAPFLGGVLAAGLARLPRFRTIAQTPAASAVTLLALVGVVSLFWGPFRPIPMTLASLAFCSIAAGNSVFGALTLRPARLLGEVSYSMYLLHAILLFVLVNWTIGLPSLAVMPATTYWPIILGLTPVLVALCVVTFIFIEKPAMQRVSDITAALRRRMGRVRAIRG